MITIRSTRIVHEKVHPEANIKIGVVRDDNLSEIIKVTVIATGFGVRFDTEKDVTCARIHCRWLKKHPPSKNILDIPTYKRDRQQTETSAVSFAD